jgi:hypothetical protein
MSLSIQVDQKTKGWFRQDGGLFQSNHHSICPFFHFSLQDWHWHRLNYGVTVSDKREM